MKKRHIILIIFIFSLAIFLYHSEEPTKGSAQKSSASQKKEKKRIPAASEDKKENLQNTQKKSLPSIVNKKTPTIAPKELKGRWSHQSNFEDDTYLDTQLHLDGRPLEGYYFKWVKNDLGDAEELISGSMPAIEKVSGTFPHPSEFQQIVHSNIDSDTEILSTKEVWNLNSNRVLTPQAKVEVRTKSRSQKSSGHEFWYISLNSGKIVERLEADRF